jgi:hypothetical protein
MSLPWEILVPSGIGIATAARVFTEQIRSRTICRALPEALRGTRPDERPPIIVALAELLHGTQTSRRASSGDPSHKGSDVDVDNPVNSPRSLRHQESVRETEIKPEIIGTPQRSSYSRRDAPYKLYGEDCPILIADISSFGGHGRTCADRKEIRLVMYSSLQAALEHSGVSWASCHCIDRGDGAIIIAPPDTSFASIIDPLLGRLADALRQHNDRAAEGTRIQLRVALHVGSIVSDSHGIYGDAIMHAARLVDAPVLKKELSRTGADLGVMASTLAYDAVIIPTLGRFVANRYRQVKFRVKESNLTAWMYLAGPEVPSLRFHIPGLTGVK